MALGVIWAIALVALAPRIPGFVPLNVAVILGLLPGGLVMIAMIGRLAQRRFFDDDLIDGDAFAPGSGGDIDQRVLTNTTEQLVLAAAIWPFVGMVLGGQIVVALGLSFAVTRVLFWIGYHLSPPLRGLGFAAGFYPTIAAAVWTVAVWFF
jgi:hypothetical protein